MLKLFNSLTRKIEEFKPINPPRHGGQAHVGMYTCGPTVYDFAHIGNFRTYTTADLLLRTLQYNGFTVKYVMNLTDVGHLTGDNLGDADIGEDRIEEAAKRGKKSVWDIANFYTKAFLIDYQRLNLEEPSVGFVKATDHIKEQIQLIKTLEEKGFTYKISDGIYFDTAKFKDYGKLSSLDQIKEGARVEINPEKRNPRDFALWKFSPKDTKRQMEWNSPWGIGFPGWHIECSAMSLKYLGDAFENNSFHDEQSRTIDIHVGGMDLKSTHHPNEIAQSEAATGKTFVKYWVHAAFMLVDGKRMSKSLGNNYKVQDLINKGFDPLSLRYLYLQTHYRQEMNFTWKALRAAQKALNDLYDQAEVFGVYPNFISDNREPSKKVLKKFEEFEDAANNDLNMPGALAALHEGLKLARDDFDNFFLLERTDEVLGLKFKETGIKLHKENKRLNKGIGKLTKIEKEVTQLVQERERLRKEKQFGRADQIRNRIKKLGYEIEDVDEKSIIKKI